MKKRLAPLVTALLLAIPGAAYAHEGEPDATGAVDPTTATQRLASQDAVGDQRDDPDPALRTVPVDPAQPQVPTDRYNLFNSCYSLQSTATRKWLNGALTVQGQLHDTAIRFYFKPTELGTYLLYTLDRRFLSGANGALKLVSSPSQATNWTVTQPAAGSFRLNLPGQGYLATSATNTATFSPAVTGRTQWTPVKRAGCTSYPEVEVNVTGNPHAGVTSYQETRGYIDAHTHGMAFEFLGGQVHCGRPWHTWGVAFALRDCPDHELTTGKGALVEAFLSGQPTHDPVGWPTFKDWPAPHSLTHEGTYYKWMERSWRGGQRLLVNLLVENNQLCTLYPLKRNSCDDMASIRLQARDMRLLERYVDAQHGGPGKGWYRIVTHPDEARRVINAGKMAVVMGIETSVPFNCHYNAVTRGSGCTQATLDKHLDEMKQLGVVQMELVNKFDNSLSGVAGDTGTTGYLVNGANTLETLSPWKMRTCVPNDYPADNGVHDKNQDNSAPIPDQDALFGAVLSVLPVNLPAIPLYPSPHHCNDHGLTALGEHVIRGMAKRNMLFDPDHMSLKARKAALDVTEGLGYSGVLSSHSWSTPDAYPRIYQQGGFIAPYAGDSTSFVDAWRKLQEWASPQSYWGVGFGADINGLGAQGDPRGAGVANPVTYPFTGYNGVVIGKQQSGQRTYDINADGVSHYGLYPDWVEDLRKLAGPDIVQDLARGTEAYLQTWERAYGIAPNACTVAAEQLPASTFTALPKGLTTWAVLTRVGQPASRLGKTFTYCAGTGQVRVAFDDNGRLTGVS